MESLNTTYIWYLLSFISFFALVWHFARNAIVNMLDSRIEDIRKEIETAENLRVEAQELLAQYQRKHRDALKISDDIIHNAKNHAKAIQDEAAKELSETMLRREKQLADRLERMQQSAILEIQQYAADLSTKATAEIIAKELNQKAGQALIDQAIKGVEKKIH